MEIKKIEVKKIEYVTTYIANDGTEFLSEDECKKYEKTARSVIHGMFKKLPIQITENLGEHDPFGCFSYDDTLYAVSVRNIDDVETVNRWIMSHGNYNDPIGADTVGTIQLFDVYDSSSVWNIGTPYDLKKKYNEAIDKLFDSLVQKDEGGNSNE